VQAFLLDEYVGLPPSHPQSYAHVIRQEFTDHVDIDSARVHGPDGIADDIFTAAEHYDASITQAGPVDVQLLGIGANGHIGFNEPGSSLGSRTRVKTLTEQTRHDNARFFSSIDEVPRHVITQGLGTISSARHLVLIATGGHKADCRRSRRRRSGHRKLSGLGYFSCTRTVTVVVDEAAAAQLGNADFYRYALNTNPCKRSTRLAPPEVVLVAPPAGSLPPPRCPPPRRTVPRRAMARGRRCRKTLQPANRPSSNHNASAPPMRAGWWC